jgi:CHASE3 domain sensor protein
VSRQRLHSSGLRPIIEHVATAQRELTDISPQSAQSRLNALRTALFLLRSRGLGPIQAITSSEGPSLHDSIVEPLEGRIRDLLREVEDLQDQLVAERQAVALIMRELGSE